MRSPSLSLPNDTISPIDSSLYLMLCASDSISPLSLPCSGMYLGNISVVGNRQKHDQRSASLGTVQTSPILCNGSALSVCLYIPYRVAPVLMPIPTPIRHRLPTPSRHQHSPRSIQTTPCSSALSMAPQHAHRDPQNSSTPDNLGSSSAMYPPL